MKVTEYLELLANSQLQESDIRFIRAYTAPVPPSFDRAEQKARIFLLLCNH